jgi:hypothetical protein
MLRVVSAADEDVLKSSICIDIETLGDGSNAIWTKSVLGVDVGNLTRFPEGRKWSRDDSCCAKLLSSNLSLCTAHVHRKLGRHAECVC